MACKLTIQTQITFPVVLGQKNDVLWSGGGTFQEDVIQIPLGTTDLSPDQLVPLGTSLADRSFARATVVINASLTWWEGTVAARSTGKTTKRKLPSLYYHLPSCSPVPPPWPWESTVSPSCIYMDKLLCVTGLLLPCTLEFGRRNTCYIPLQNKWGKKPTRQRKRRSNNERQKRGKVIK